MSQDSFDDHIRQTLANHQSEVDAQAIWEAVKPHRKRRGLWLWLLWPALLAGGAVGWWLYPSGATAPEQTAAAAIRRAAPQMAAGHEPAGLSPTGGAAAAPIAAGTAPILSAAPTAGRAAQSAATATGATAAAPAQAGEINTSHALPQHKNTALPPQPAPALDAPAAASPLQPTPAATAAAPPAPIAATVPETQSTAADDLQWLWAVEPLPLRPSRVRYPAPAAPEAEAYPPKARTDRWYAGVQATAYLPFRSLEGSANDSTGWHDLRIGSETTLEAVGIEAILGRKLRPNLRLQTGLALNRLTERFEWRADQTLRDSVMGIQSIFIDAAGDSTFVEGLVQRYQYVSRYKRTYNTYTFVDLPVIAALDMGKGPLQFSVEAGLWLNLSLRAQGNRLAPDGLDTERLEDSNDYRNRAGLSFHGGLGARYLLGRRWALSGAITMRYFPGPITVAASATEQRYQWIGARLGLLYRW